MSGYDSNCAGAFGGAGIIVFSPQINHFTLTQAAHCIVRMLLSALFYGSAWMLLFKHDFQQHWRLSSWWACRPCTMPA